MKITKRALSILGAAATASAAAVVVHPIAANAAATCASAADAGKLKYGISGKHFVWDVAQKDREENFSGRTESIQFVVQASATRSNSYSVSTTVKFSADALWASFSAEVSANIGTETSKTTFSQTTRTYSLPTGDSYYFGQGTGKWTATATVYRCQKVNIDLYGWVDQGSGPLVGYTGLTHAVVACKSTPPASSFSAVLKQNC